MLPTARKADFSEIPVIDMAPLASGRPEDRMALAQTMSKSCRDTGFMYIINHGIAQSEIDQMFRAAEMFFSLPKESRMEVLLTKSPSWRGYLPMDLNKGNDVRIRGNLQESFQIWAEPKIGQQTGTMVSPNQWPSAMPELRELMVPYRAKLSDLAMEIIRLLALGLGLDEKLFAPLFSEQQGMLRLLHYPPQKPDVDDGRIGTRAHTDTGAVTILAQDSNGGLQVMNRSEEWIEVPPLAGSYVVNIGEMMKLLTDGFYRSTPHRVINRSGRERYSVPFFADPNFEVLIKPVIKNPDPTEGPQFESSYSRDTVKTCGQILAETYARIWPPLISQTAETPLPGA